MSSDNRVSRWYFGGLGSAGELVLSEDYCVLLNDVPTGAACVTHPLDLIKVQLQTAQEGKVSIVQLTGNIIRKQGITALYNGISASLLRQLTYSTTRFGIYEMGKQTFGNDLDFLGKVLLAGGAGACGGVVGTPADLVNVRMQNDVKLPAEQRRK